MTDLWPAVPCVIPTKTLPTEGLMEMVQRVALKHYADDPEGELTGEEGSLSTHVFPLCAGRGSVTPHVDDLDGEAEGRLVYGWVLKSEGHRLHVEGKTPPEGLLLSAGDVYVIEPLVRHWTVAPHWWSELIFAVAVVPPEERSPEKLAHDYFWTVLKAVNDHEHEQARREAEERAAYHSIESLDLL